MPTEVFEEWLRLPVGFMEQLIEYRAYAQIAGSLKFVEESPLVELAKVIDAEWAKSEFEALNAG